MVFFSCYACGDSMRKNAVEKHRMRCRRSSTFSCLDCGVDFPGDSYQMHMKCVSEQQKYSGGAYQDSQSKGELKQEQWIARLRKTLQNIEPSNAPLRNVLEKLMSHGNVPRKQNKFKNFMKTSLRIRDDKLIDDAWAAISAAPEESNGANGNGRAVTATNGNGLKREMEEEEPDERQPPEKKVKKAELLSVAEEAQAVVQEMTKQLKKKCRSAVKKTLRESAEERVKVKAVQKAVLPTLQNEGVTKEMLRSYIKSLETHKKFILDGKYISLRKKT